MSPPGDAAAPPCAQGHVPPEAALPIVLVPGLLTSARLYAGQIAALWRFGPVLIADNTAGESIQELAQSVLAAAPSRFALAGLSMGGYVAFEIMRQASGRVARLALLDTSARPDTPAQRGRRHEQIAMARAGRFADIPGELWPSLVGPAAQDDQGLRRIVQEMAEETGPDAFIRQQRAIMSRPGSLADLPAITCPALALVGDSDALTPPELCAEIAAGIPGSRHAVIPGSGHLTTLEQPDLMTRALVEWLAA